MGIPRLGNDVICRNKSSGEDDCVVAVVVDDVVVDDDDNNDNDRVEGKDGDVDDEEVAGASDGAGADNNIPVSSLLATLSINND